MQTGSKPQQTFEQNLCSSYPLTLPCKGALGTPLTAVSLVLASCGLHALWNLFVKQANDKEAFTALFLFAIPILYAPYLPSSYQTACRPSVVGAVL